MLSTNVKNTLGEHIKAWIPTYLLTCLRTYLPTYKLIILFASINLQTLDLFLKARFTILEPTESLHLF